MSTLDVSHDEIGYGMPHGTLALPFAAMKTIWHAIRWVRTLPNAQFFLTFGGN